MFKNLFFCWSKEYLIRSDRANRTQITTGREFEVACQQTEQIVLFFLSLSKIFFMDISLR